ncbi:MAG TPA: DUF948 domain-containing protein [Candidatus Aminicenantes bacterium]|nr:DUF948 domain-containing protein [Candidatus Aminicenantes bacterium]
MPLTLNQTLFLILTIAAVVAVIFLVRFLIQLQKTAKQAEIALIDLQEALDSLKDVEQKVNARMDDLGDIIDSSKKTLAGISETTFFLTTRLVRPASKYWPLLYPLIRLGWRQLKQRKKERKNVG